MSGPTRYSVGDVVRITDDNMQTIWNGCRSIKRYPNELTALKMQAVSNYGGLGTVTHVFSPGYEVVVKFDIGGTYHMKDNWITKVPAGDRIK